MALLRLSLEIGYDAVMQGRTKDEPEAVSRFHDPVQVTAVDLTAYDALCGQRREVSV